MWRSTSVSSRTGFDRIIGQDLAKRVLSRAVREGQPAHAYLFLGLQGTGKATTALEFGKALNCEAPHDGNACEQCANCHAVEHGNFPDMRVWSPKGQDTIIDHMREMRDMAAFRPIRGKWVVNIVEQGDTLNENSANCILKLLEEPPPYVVNILLYRNAANVLPTIRSRCQLVRFDQVNADELAARLVEDHDASAEEADFLSIYTQGRPGLAIGLMDNDEFQRKRDIVAAVAAKAAGGNPWAALGLAEAVRGGTTSQTAEAETDDEEGETPTQTRSAGARKGARDATNESLDMLLVWYRDLLATKLQGNKAIVVNSDKREELLEQATRYAHGGPLLNRVEAILHAKRRIQGNGNPQIVTEALMMHLTH
jgi:DNA polymerase-3 subunit delta'